jgi:DNA repair protein RecN (Recombination protein N)
LQARPTVAGSNSEKIYSSLSTAFSKLYENEEGESAYDQIGAGIVQLESISGFDENIKSLKNSMEDIYYRLEDILKDIRNYRDNIQFDEDELDEIEQRIDLINKLKRKYGNSIEEILSYEEGIEKELSQMEKSEELLEELLKKKEEYDSKLQSMAGTLSLKRRETAEMLKGLIEKELKYLGMEKAVFKVEVTEKESLNINGKNDVYFTMTANPGEPLRPLSKVASGGEMSRIMLAIKSVIADIDSIPTLIFDEIDTGVSGKTAQSVAEKMCSISKIHQLLCVTHLPQIAAMADHHYKIQKLVEENKTTTHVERLSAEEQIDELGRLLSGARVTELTRQHAKEMLELADSQKKKL